ncbi:DUF3455 domain-containing protein [Streptomyces echinatus]|uniref:DUF3455 domain-containing protein n=2 Tax=Streptomyces echinatus TaxID=67293 RepID=A0A7W9PPU9_9ACTN|nr:hypothetical protein [Streptomyces echinatus]
MLFGKRVALIIGTVITSAAAMTGAAAAGPATGIPVPLQVPAGNEKIAEFDAQGVQTYACTDNAWTFVEPAATLSDSRDRYHRPVALHSRGPVWVSTVDGSAVNAAAVPGASVPRDHAVPELLLKATATRGSGVFGSVSYVQRLNTRGGLAPSGSCAQGAQVGVPYAATYVFYAPAQ